MKKKLSFTIVALFTAGILFSTSAVVFKNLGRWLVISDPLPEKLDVIFVFGWDLRRVKHAVRLSDKYPGALLVFSDPFGNHFTRPENNYYKKHISGFNMDTSRIIALTGCKNTFDEVQLLKQFLFEPEATGKHFGYKGSKYNNIKTDSLINICFVSSPLHMRRISMSVKKVLGSAGVKPYMSHVPLEDFGYDEKFFNSWWKQGNNTVFLEWVKIFWYYFFKL